MSRNLSEDYPNSSAAFRLGTFEFRMENAELVDATGTIVRLRKQSAEVLRQLLARRGEVVTKAELFEAVWPGTTVTDDSLVQCISEIRRCLGDRGHRLVQTLSGRGYRADAIALGSRRDAAPRDRPSVAVLAFDDFSAGGDSGYLSDAIAEGITAELSRFTELNVIARNSSFSLRAAPRDVTTIARQLGVEYLIEGSQQKHGDRLRVTVQLIDAPAARHLWSETYERDLADLLGAQSDIVQRVVATAAQKLINAEGGNTARVGATQRTALLHHLVARKHLVKFTPEANEQARQEYLAAIRADPAQPYGYAGLAFVLINGHRWGWTELGRDEALDQARTAARKAVELDPEYYDGHAALAYVHLEENDLDRAIARAQRAHDLNANDIYAMCDLAEFLAYAGQTGRAEELLRTAVRLNPHSPDWIRWNLAWVEWLKGDFEGALQTMKAMTDMPPMANRVLALIHMSLGRQDDAQRAIRTLLETHPGHSLAEVRRNYAGKFADNRVFERILTLLGDAGLPE